MDQLDDCHEMHPAWHHDAYSVIKYIVMIKNGLKMVYRCSNNELCVIYRISK